MDELQYQQTVARQEYQEWLADPVAQLEYHEYLKQRSVDDFMASGMIDRKFAAEITGFVG